MKQLLLLTNFLLACVTLEAQTITTYAGIGTGGFSGDGGSAISAQLNEPYGIATDTVGNVYIADQINNRIRKVSTSGIISTFAGGGHPGL
jgi:hypothetical protein